LSCELNQTKLKGSTLRVAAFFYGAAESFVTQRQVVIVDKSINRHPGFRPDDVLFLEGV
jgi:hypothetical protein